MDDKQIKVVIDIDGNVSVEALGCTGDECKEFTKGLEKALGDVVADVAKPEMYKQPQQTQAKRNW